MQQNSNSYEWKVGDILDAPVQNYPQRKFKLLNLLGQGGEGVVFKVESINWNKTQQFALKIHFGEQKMDYLNFLDQIIQFQNTNESQEQTNTASSIIRIYERFETIYKNIVIVMELGNQDVFEYLNQNKFINLQLIGNFCIQMAKAVNFLHHNQLIHRDLKPENFMMIGQQIKMIDFGLITNQNRKLMTTFIGSILFQAPEIMFGVTDYTESIDIWSLGCIFYELIKKEPLFNVKTRQEVEDLIKQLPNNQKFIIDKINQLQISDQWKAVLIEMLQPDPNNRPKIYEVLQKLEKQSIMKVQNFQPLFVTNTQNFNQNQNQGVIQQIKNLIFVLQNPVTINQLKSNIQAKPDIEKLIQLLEQIFIQISSDNLKQNKIDRECQTLEQNIQEKIEFSSLLINEILNNQEFKIQQESLLSQVLQLHSQNEVLKLQLGDMEDKKLKINLLTEEKEKLEQQVLTQEDQLKEDQISQELEIQVEHLRKKRNDLRSELQKMYQDQQYSFEEFKKQKENEILQLKQYISFYQLRISKLDSLNQIFEDDKVILNKLRQDLKEKSNLEKEIEEQYQIIVQLEFQVKGLDKLQEQNSNQQKTIESLQQEVQKYKQQQSQFLEQQLQIQQYQIQIGYLQKETNELQSNNTKRQNLLNELHEELIHYQNELKTAEEKNDEIKMKQFEIRKQIDILEQKSIEIERNQQLFEANQKTLESLREEIQQKQQQLKDLEQMKSQISELITQKNNLNDQINLKQLKDQQQMMINAKVNQNSTSIQSQAINNQQFQINNFQNQIQNRNNISKSVYNQAPLKSEKNNFDFK